jgi:hypothetical protein
MLDALVAHITGQDSGAGFGALAAFQAQATGRLAWITATEVSVPGATDGYDRPDPHQADLLREVIGEADGLDGLSLRLRTHLQRRFGEEELMDHAEAYVLNLVDHISGITPEENVEW